MVPAPEFAAWQPFSTIQLRPIQAVEGARTDKAALPEPQIRLLSAIDSNPGRPSSSYAGLAQMGRQRAIEIRCLLVDGGYLREHRVATGQRGRNAIVLELTDKARTALERDERDAG